MYHSKEWTIKRNIERKRERVLFPSELTQKGRNILYDST